METLGPVYTAPLFSPLLEELLALLRGLEADAWQRSTVAGRWRVRDVAAHLLDGDLRRLAATRDDHAPKTNPPARSYDDLVGLIDELNATGVAYGERLSPRLLVDLLEVTGRWVSGFFLGLPPHGPAAFPVAWAGEEHSENWMDIGREYTERWHHQMQIRDAAGAPGLLGQKWMRPLLDLSVRALPSAYSRRAASEGTGIVLEVTGESNGTWSVVRGASSWSVFRGAIDGPAAVARMSGDIAWRLFYNALPPVLWRDSIEVEGEARLVEPMLLARSVMVRPPRGG